MKNIIFIAPPAAGKGTMSKLLHEKYGLVHISVGQLLRDIDPLSSLGKKIKENPAELFILATNAVTGERTLFTKDDINEFDYFPLMASSCLPIVGKPVFKNGVPYFDGGMSDPVPVKMLCDMGCDKIVLILTKPKDVLRTPGKDAYAAKLLKKKYPKAAEGLSDRYRLYNEGVFLAKKLEKEGKALIIAPDDCCGVDTLKRTKESIKSKQNILNYYNYIYSKNYYQLFS